MDRVSVHALGNELCLGIEQRVLLMTTEIYVQRSPYGSKAKNLGASPRGIQRSLDKKYRRKRLNS